MPFNLPFILPAVCIMLTSWLWVSLLTSIPSFSLPSTCPAVLMKVEPVPKLLKLIPFFFPKIEPDDCLAVKFLVFVWVMA